MGGTRGERAASRRGGILAGLAWVAAYGVLFLAATIASAMALHRLAPGAPKWLFPVSHGVLWIAGVLLVTWLVRV